MRVNIENGGGGDSLWKRRIMYFLQSNAMCSQQYQKSETPYMNYFLKSDLKRVPDGILGGSKRDEIQFILKIKCNL